jgi:hypothetical protein
MPDLRSRRRRHIDAYGRSAAELPRLAGSLPGSVVAAGLLIVVIAGFYLGHRIERSSAEKAPATVLRAATPAPQPLRDAFEAAGPRLAAARHDQAAALAAKADPEAQARAATAIGRAYADARGRLAAVHAGPGEPRQAMLAALQSAATGYGALAAAARSADRSAYSRASVQVDAAERTLVRLSAADDGTP